MGLVAPRHVGSSWTRARTRVPCIGRRILNHCTTREALILSHSCPPLTQEALQDQQLLKPAHLESMLHNKRSHRNEKPMHRNEE
ncbi:hypothetical protein J1605_007298 [Eschrichtius robustus]|uniref:Uncharacterized protein n=1 Tax=Eschrichtius robustus TaxID=9764 RepID=A0AB34GXX1_ESCRO|nr:hypothetical protein J1605_007298 [Eschrichtius robustus]